MAPVKVTDARGRVLTVRRLRLREEMALMRAAGGAASANARWMMMTELAASVRDIDGVPLKFPTSEAEMEAHFDRVEGDGVAAALEALRADVPDDVAVAAEAALAGE